MRLIKKKDSSFHRNRSAEKLYGWMSYEVLGKRDTELLIIEEYNAFLNKIVEKLISGQSWAGQFPFKRKSGELFMALVTKSPLYENGHLTGVVTVSSDAAVFNGLKLGDLRVYQDHGRQRWLKMKRSQWYPPRPQLPSSVSNLVLMHSIANTLSHFCYLFLFWFYFHFF